MALKSFSTARLPTLALQDGDVIIYSSRQPKGIFVVHSHVLAGKSRYFKAALSKEWGVHARSVKEGSNSPKVYEMDLHFDTEIHLALPITRKTNKFLDDSDRQPPDLGSDYKHTRNGKGRSPKQFLWNEPQPVPKPSPYVGSRRPHLKRRNESLYEDFLEAASERYMPYHEPDGGMARPDHYMIPRTSVTHSRAVLHVRKIWKCLLLLMYGHEITLSPSRAWIEQMALVATLLAYADALQIADDIKQQVGRMLMSMPRIGQHVSEEPVDFFHLAYHLDLPQLYIDATKHVVSTSDCHQGYQTHFPAFSETECCNEEMHAILLAGCVKHGLLLDSVRRAVCKSSLFDPHRVVDQVHPQLSQYYPLLKRAFCLELLPQLNAEPTGIGYGRIGPKRKDVRIFGQAFGTIVEALRWLMDLPDSMSNTQLDQVLGLTAMAKEGGVEPKVLIRWTKKVLRIFKEDVPLLGAPRRRKDRLATTNEHIRDFLDNPPVDYLPEDFKYDCPCSFCSLAEYQSKDRVASLMPDWLFPDQATKPWPLKGELHEDKIPVYPAKTELVPASYAYLKSIGLGAPFRNLARKEKRAIREQNRDVWALKDFDLPTAFAHLNTNVVAKQTRRNSDVWAAVDFDLSYLYKEKGLSWAAVVRSWAVTS